jgi:uncharacterized membrane protein (UPF0182 family)
VVAVFAALLLGRWMAVTTADGLWANALGVGPTLGQIERLRSTLWVLAFLAAALWCVGNLYLVYRSIRSVHVPRRLGDLEILEAVPRRLLLVLAVLVGLGLAVALTRGASDWWQARMLTGFEAPLGITDPVLQRDLSDYLFHLPWTRTKHAFVTSLAGIVLAVCVVVYAALGAVRWSRRRVQVTDLARWHLACLSAAFALALFWGYRIEPSEYVAGVHGVPADAVLLAVRIPAARVLSAVALLVVGGSLLWLWSERVVLVLLPWTLLALGSFAGHYVVPAFAGAVRSPEDLVVADVEMQRRQFEEIAYGTTYADTPLDPARELRARPSATSELTRVPVWDAFAVTVLLNRIAAPDPHTQFAQASLGIYGSRSGPPVAAYVAPREVELSAAREVEADLSWEQVHIGPLAYARGAAAVHANRVSETGLPFFVADLDAADSATPQVSELGLRQPDVIFAPGVTDFAVLPAGDQQAVGVPLGGVRRRIALAWILQSPRLITSDAVSDQSLVLWHRNVVERLERYAPFARFGHPRATVAAGRLYWIANGYLAAEAFPLAPAARWRTKTVRYLRSNLIGVVDASSGETAVYLLRSADPLGSAWAQLLPQIVRPASQIPRELLPNLPYPMALLSVQVELLRRSAFRTGPVDRPFASVAGAAGSAGVQEYHWWVGTSASDSVPRLRLVAPLEIRESGLLAALVDGTVRDGALSLELFRSEGPPEVLGPAQVARQFAGLRGDVAGLEGAVRMVPSTEGVLAVQSTYVSPGDAGAVPQLVDVAVALGGAVGNGPTIGDAAERLRAATSPAGGGSREWLRARQWFERMDAARRAGDWNAFGRAYDELRRLLVGASDTLP